MYGLRIGSSARRARLCCVVGLLTAAVGCSDDTAQELSLAQLAGQQDSYAGRTVRTSGTLRRHADPLHWWLEDSAFNRVELDYRGELVGMLGTELVVEGEFQYRRDRGRWIVVRSLAVASDAAEEVSHND